MNMLDALMAELHEQIDAMARMVADGELDGAEAAAASHEDSLRQALLLHGAETDPAIRTRGAMKLVTILEMQRDLLSHARAARDIVAAQLRDIGRSSQVRRAYSGQSSP